MWKTYRLIVFLLIIPYYVHGQTDSLFIKTFPQKFAIQISSEQRFIYLNDWYEDVYDRTYKPNNPINIGLGLTINNTVFSFGYGYGFDFTRDKSKGKTKSFDFQLHNYNRKYTFDFYVQKYKGMYMEENDNKGLFYLCPDMKIRSYGLFGQYVFNGNKFSYKAAFNQSEKQLISAGSLLLGGGIYYTNIRSDSSFVFNDKNNLKNFQFGASIGYAYTWVINRKVYLGGSITGGVNFGNESIDRIGKEKLEVYPTLYPRAFAGYNKDNWSIGLTFQAIMNYSSLSDDRQIDIISGNFQIKYIRRLDNIPILSKIFK